MKSIITWVVFLFVTSAGQGLHGQVYECSKWEVTDIFFSAGFSEQIPFDITFGAVFSHENGREMKVPGFYNGNNEWIIRVSFSEEGTWKYLTYSSLTALDGGLGSVRVFKNSKPDRHGAIKICSDNPRRFAYEDGTPYFSLAFEVDWLFAPDAENPKAIPNTRQLIGHMADNGFNKAIMNVYAYDAGWGDRDRIDPRFNFAKPSVFPFGGTNEEPDHSTINIEFFRRLDRVMAELHEHELVSHLMIYVWNKFVNWPRPGSQEDNRYFEYVVKRYQAFPNLIWDISKEALAYGMDDMSYIAERIERLRELDGHRRLVTVHDYNFCRNFPEKVDFIAIQEWRPNLYNEMLEVAGRHSDKPVYNVEHGGYESTMHNIFGGAYSDPLVCLDRTYTCIFAGTYSTYYWQNTSWYEVVYDPFSLDKDRQPNFRYYKNLVEFFGNFNFNELEPSQYLYSPYCLTNNKDIFIYYITSGMIAAQGMPPQQLRGKRVEVQWYDPLSGTWTEKTERNIGSWTGIRKPDSVESPFALLVLRLKENQ